MDDRERGLAFLFAITLPPIMVWFLVAKFTYGIDASTAKYLIPYLVKNTFSLWPLWSALIAGWFIGIGGLIAFIIYDKSRVFKGERFKKIYRRVRLEKENYPTLSVLEGANKSPNIKMRLCKYLNLIN